MAWNAGISAGRQSLNMTEHLDLSGWAAQSLSLWQAIMSLTSMVRTCNSRKKKCLTFPLKKIKETKFHPRYWIAWTSHSFTHLHGHAGLLLVHLAHLHRLVSDDHAESQRKDDVFEHGDG